MQARQSSLLVLQFTALLIQLLQLQKLLQLHTVLQQVLVALKNSFHGLSLQ